MNIDLLRECVHLSSTLSFTETAKHFYITQPVLSKHISSIEKEIGFKLFSRSKNGVHLTNVGRMFVLDVADVLDKYDNALERCEQLYSGKDNFINMAYLFGASMRILPGALKEFRKKHPETEVQYLSVEIDAIPSLFDENKIDFAITSDLNKFNSERFNWLELYGDTLCFVAPKNHPLANRDIIEIDELVGEEIILPRSTFMTNESTYIQEMLSPIEDTIKPRRLIGDLASVMMSIMAEKSVAIEFSHLKHYFDEDEIVFIPINTNIPKFNVIAIWKRSKETKAMLDLAQELKHQCIKKNF